MYVESTVKHASHWRHKGQGYRWREPHRAAVLFALNEMAVWQFNEADAEAFVEYYKRGLAVGTAPDGID